MCRYPRSELDNNRQKQSPISGEQFASSLSDTEDGRFAFYTREATPRERVDFHHKMIVNSLPKSGSIWMLAMLRHLFQFKFDGNPQIVHVSDIAQVDPRTPVFGVVVLVRDLRDVVLSLYHETVRNDVRAGFPQVRYPSAEAFYFEHLIGFLQSEARYEQGRLTDWLDFVTGRGFPLIRYEDLLLDPAGSLRKVMTFWKVTASDDEIWATQEALKFENMPQVAADMGGMIGETVANGHLRRGKAGGWKEELTDRVLADIADRFGEFQARLGYS